MTAGEKLEPQHWHVSEVQQQASTIKDAPTPLYSGGVTFKFVLGRRREVP